jgi:hypothetical protein
LIYGGASQRYWRIRVRRTCATAAQLAWFSIRLRLVSRRSPGTCRRVNRDSERANRHRDQRKGDQQLHLHRVEARDACETRILIWEQLRNKTHQNQVNVVSREAAVFDKRKEAYPAPSSSWALLATRERRRAHGGARAWHAPGRINGRPRERPEEHPTQRAGRLRNRCSSQGIVPISGP